MESGGVSVADLVQKHSASRADLTPVDPHQLQQNTLMSGRRARQDRQNADGPAGRGNPGEAPRRQAPPPPSIADALGGDAPDLPRDDAPRPGRRAARFPQDDNARRPHPGEAARNGRRAAEAPGEQPGQRHPSGAFLPNPGETSGHHAFPSEAPPEPPARRSRRTGETSGHHATPGDAPSPSPRPRRARRAPDAPDGPPRRAGEASAHHAIPGDGFGPGETSGHHAVQPDGFGPNGHHAAPAEPAFPRDDVPRNGRPGEPFPRKGRRGETSARLPVVPDDPRNGFGPNGHHPSEPPAFPHGRHPGEAHAIPGPNGRHPGETSGHHAVPGPNGRHPGETSGHHAVQPDGFGPNGRHPGDLPAPGGRRVGEASTHMPLPGRRPGETSGHHAFPGEEPPAFPRDDAPHNGRRPGEASAHLPVPGRFPVDDARRQGPPTPPPGQWPGEPLSEPRLTPAAIDAPDSRSRSTGVPPVPPIPPPPGEDLISMTTEMEPIGDIGEDVQKRRTIDHTLARFSAVHDEIKAEEQEKKAKRRKLMPWQKADDEMDRLDEMEIQQSMAMRIPVIPADDEADDDEDPKKARGRKKKKKKLRGRSAGKAFVVIVAGLVFTSTAAAWGFKAYIEGEANTVDALDPDSAAIKDAAAQVGDENFLLVGSDTRSGAAAEDGVGDDKTVEGARSDTVMIAHIPKNRERAVVVSFPRDLEVTRPACEGWNSKTGELNGQQHPAEEQVKLNTAYMIGGPKCVTKMVQELSGLAINHFVGIDFHGFKDMVDAVDGVQVCVEKPMKDDVLGTVVPQAGKNVTLTGDQALNFVRARHVQGDVTSDYGRIIRQQRFLSALLRKAMSGEVLLNPGKLTDFVGAFSKATFGDNIGVDQLFTLGQSMQEIQAGKVTFITVPTTGYENERHNEELRAEANKALFEAIRQDTPLPGEAPDKKPADDAADKPQQSTLAQDEPQGPVDPKTIKIQVLNGGNPTGGIAGRTADSLEEYGFQVVRVDSAPDIDKPAIIRYSKERVAAAQTLQAAVPGSVLQEDPSMVGAILLTVGPGFDGEVVSPTGGGKTAEVPDGLSTVNAGDVSCA
jgi:LCP family protein required for cell wall assembly